MSLMGRRLMMMLLGQEEENMAQARIIVDYTIEEESNVIQVALSKEQINAICECKEIHVVIEMNKPESEESSGTLTFGIYNSSGYYPVYFVNNANNATPTSLYAARALFNLYKNYAADTLFFIAKCYPTNQYASKSELGVANVSECIGKSNLILKAITTTVFGIGTRIALVII